MLRPLCRPVRRPTDKNNNLILQDGMSRPMNKSEKASRGVAKVEAGITYMQTMENGLAERKQKLAAATKKLNTTALHVKDTPVGFSAERGRQTIWDPTIGSSPFHIEMVPHQCKLSDGTPPLPPLLLDALLLLHKLTIPNPSKSYQCDRRREDVYVLSHFCGIVPPCVRVEFNRIMSTAVAYYFLAGWGDMPGAAERRGAIGTQEIAVP
ncbi:hypothetical protein V496_10302 [Pseudogymnoascus sp. VKM F-4515 (FW-2607)]|nr:hypothetical protein V496_10302 [Pseudogymnoascus sp. VKM F-4515 (FW-2607)]